MTTRDLNHRDPAHTTFKMDWLIIAGLSAILIYVLPWVVWGEAGYVRIHDNLDSILSWYSVMRQHGFWFAGNLDYVGPIFAEGAPRVSYPNELSIASLLFAVLEPYWAYVTYQFIFRVAAFTGMYALLQTLLPNAQPHQRTITFGVSLCYALLPYFAWAAGPAVLAWIAYALLRGWRNVLGPLDILVLVVAPLFSTFAFTGFFVVATALLLIPIAHFAGRLNWRLVAAVGLVTVSHIVVEYRLFAFILVEGFETHRVDFVTSTPSILDAANEFVTDLINGNGHAPSLHYLIIPVAGLALVQWKKSRSQTPAARNRRTWVLPIWIVASLLAFFAATYSTKLANLGEASAILAFPQLLLSFVPLLVLGGGVVLGGWMLAKAALFGAFRQHKPSEPLSSQQEANGLFPAGPALIIFLWLLFALSAFYGIWLWNGLDFVREAVPILGQFNVTRLVFARPFVWMLVFALALVVVARSYRIRLGLALIIGLQVAVELSQHEFLVSRRQEGVSFRQFFAEDQFNVIKNAISSPQSTYVVGSVGLHPSIAQYNGFRTADAYFSLYPKVYKLKFRRAVAREFSRLPELMQYFDEWGSRAYFFSSEIMCPRNGTMCLKTEDVSISRLELDMNDVKLLGVNYLFSVAPIGNSAELGLSLLGKFENAESAWSIFVYEVG